MWAVTLVTLPLLWTHQVDCYIMSDYIQQGYQYYQDMMQKRLDYAAYDADPVPYSCRWAMGKMQHLTFPDGDTCEAQAIQQLYTTRQLLKLDDYPSLSALRNDHVIRDTWRQFFPHCYENECMEHCDDPKVTYYRTADGSCNNENKRAWGKSFTPQQRMQDPDYGDPYKIGDPREYSVVQDGTGQYYTLPPARDVSVRVFGGSDHYNDDLSHKFTVEFMAWGQFLDHDMVLTPTSKGANEANINCCYMVNGAYPIRDECFHMVIPAGDHRFQSPCMNFVRSAPAVRTDGYCLPSYREQLNQVTSFIDGSNVYGSTNSKQYELRDYGSQSHLLKVHGHNFPPADNDSACILPPQNGDGDGDMFCLKAGDERVNEVTSLAFQHILFVRLHNRIANKLKYCWRRHNYYFDSEHARNERFFQEAREIIIATIQKVTYNEWLPKVIGTTLMEKLKLRVGYDEDNYYEPTVNPTIFNVFAAAAFRFGHSLIPRFQSYNVKDPETPYYYAYKDQTFTTHDLKDVFFKPNLLQQDATDHMDEFSNWLIYDRSKMADRKFTDMITDHLFEDINHEAADLPARNIQRARDHGIKGYTKWRHLAGLPDIYNWADLENGYTHTLENINKLKLTYKSVHDIDLYAGGMTEKHVSGGVVGPTFAHIIAKQFHVLKHGDSFWFERKKHSGYTSHLTEGQITAIKKWTLAKIICELMDLHEIQKDVFKVPTIGEFWECKHLPDLDLTHWGCYYPDGLDFLRDEDSHVTQF